MARSKAGKATIGGLAVLLTGCASPSHKILPAYVPVSTYAGASCADIERDIVRVRTKLVSLGAMQDLTAKRDRDAVMMSLFLFWPTIFMVRGDVDRNELARAKGEFDALVAAGIDKGCITPQEGGDARFSYIPPPLPRVDWRGNPIAEPNTPSQQVR